FLAQYNHALLDNNAAIMLLRELDRLSRETTRDLPGPAAMTASTHFRRHLRTFPRSRRKQAVRATIAEWRRGQRGGIARLATAAARRDPVRLRIASRCLDAEAARAVQSRSLRVCGFPSLSMALVASVFRAVAQLNPRERERNANFCVGLGVDLGLRRAL